MTPEVQNTDLKTTRKQFLFAALAVIAAVVLLFMPVFSFETDRGILFVRSFSMSLTTFTVTQTELGTGIAHIIDTMPIHGLLYCHIVMLIGSTLCLLLLIDDKLLNILDFIGNSWRVGICDATIVAAGLYYLFALHYAREISDIYFATLYPNFMVFMPAVVLQTMLFHRKMLLRLNNTLMTDY